MRYLGGLSSISFLYKLNRVILCILTHLPIDYWGNERFESRSEFFGGGRVALGWASRVIEFGPEPGRLAESQADQAGRAFVIAAAVSA